MITPFLPKQKEGAKVAAPTTNGKWEDKLNLLADMPGDFEIKGKVTPDALTSIPTVWAKPLLFAEALLDKDHPLHTDVEKEWKGILGIFCFKNYYNFDIQVKKCDLSQDAGKKAIKILTRLLPDQEWNKIYLIYVNDILIGGTSPVTGFFTGVEYCISTDETIPWRTKEGKLGDPTAHFNSDEVNEMEGKNKLAILKRWIEDIRAAGAGNFPSETIPLLNDWVELIKEKKYDGAFLYGKSVISDSMLQFFSRPAPFIEEEISDFFLCPTKSIKKPPIVIWIKGFEDKKACVYGSFKPDNFKVLPSPEGKELLNGKIKYPWVNAEACFFTNKVLKIPLHKDFTIHFNDLVPPLKKEIFDYFYIKDLKEMFKWEKRGESIVAILELPLKNEDTAVVSKEYNSKDIIEISNPPAVIGIWPDFYANDWSRYYMMVYGKEIVTTKNEPVEFEPVSAGKIDKKARMGQSIVWSSTKCIEGIECRMKSVPVGIILPKFNEEVPSLRADEKWDIGIDFGTTNTAVSVRKSTNEYSQILIFKNRTITVVAPLSPTETKDFVIRFLTPGLVEEERGRSVDSLLKSFKFGERNPLIPVPFSEGIVLDLTSVGDWVTTLRETGESELDVNLKWSLETDRRKRIITFLEHLLILVAAEARVAGIKKLNISWSYPSAFTQKWIEDIKQSRGPLIKEDLSSAEGVEISETMLYETESVAACKYFRDIDATKAEKMRIGSEKPAVVMDIGGGTTDIGMWVREESEVKLKVQTSVMLAGNVLIKYLCDSKIINSLVDSEILSDDEKKELLNNLSTLQDIKFPAINTLLKRRENMILKRMLVKRTELIGLRSLTLFTFGALFHYTGFLLRYLKTQGQVTGCEISLGGNGSRLLKWVGNIDLLKEIIRESAELPSETNISINFSAHPKEECARGLLSPEKLSVTQQPMKLIGEEGYKLGEASLESMRDISKEKIDLAKIIVPSKFIELENYIAKYNKIAENSGFSKIAITPHSIKSWIEDEISKKRDINTIENIGTELVQPFFIEEVKAVIENCEW